MTSISGTLRVGEANATAATLMAKQRGSRASYYAIMLGLILAGLIAGLVMSGLLADGGEPSYGKGGSIGALLGALVFLLIQRPLAMARFKRNFQARQQTLELPLRMEITADTLIYEIGGVTQIARWDVVTELFSSHDYWVFLAQANAMFAPKRLFASGEDEKRFVAEALARMTADARSRSAEAERFIGAQG